MRFLGLSIADVIPDSKMVWHFREQLTDPDLGKLLLDCFLREPGRLGLIVNEGRIVDASFAEVPRQRNSRDDNKRIKQGEVAESFDENPNKRAQEDVDARWTKKNNVNYFRYKNHVKGDSGSKLIVGYDHRCSGRCQGKRTADDYPGICPLKYRHFIFETAGKYTGLSQ